MVRLAALEPLGFRNLAAARVELGPGIVVLHGPNGAGKTNLLEAVYFGLTNRSFRTGNDRDLIAFGEPAARVELELAGGAERSVLLSALERGGERRHRIDGRKLDAATERPLVSVFHPDRLQLVKGPAAHRRAHLDRLVGALWPARADLRSRFGRTLAQRNALVSRDQRRATPRPARCRSWDERLADEAEPLIAVARRGGRVAGGARSPSSATGLGLDAAEVSYRPRHAGGREELAAELGARAAPSTSAGPTPPTARSSTRSRCARRQGAPALRLPGPAAGGAAGAAVRRARRPDRGRAAPPRSCCSTT